MPQPTATVRGNVRLRRIIDQRVRAGMARRRGVNPDTVTALVATIIKQNTERVKSVASSVTGAGGEEMDFVKSLRLFSKSFFLYSHASAGRGRKRLRLVVHTESSFTWISHQLVWVCIVKDLRFIGS
jgi:hypothetical protein